MDGGAWWATVHGVAKRQTRLNDFTFFLSFKGVPRRDAGSCPVPSLLRLPTPDAGTGHSPGTLQVGTGPSVHLLHFKPPGLAQPLLTWHPDNTHLAGVR